MSRHSTQATNKVSTCVPVRAHPNAPSSSVNSELYTNCGTRQYDVQASLVTRTLGIQMWGVSLRALQWAFQIIIEVPYYSYLHYTLTYTSKYECSCDSFGVNTMQHNKDEKFVREASCNFQNFSLSLPTHWYDGLVPFNVACLLHAAAWPPPCHPYRTMVALSEP